MSLFQRMECTGRSKTCGGDGLKRPPGGWLGSPREDTLNSEDMGVMKEVVGDLEQRVGALMEKFDDTMRQFSHQQQMCLEFRQVHRQHEEMYQLLSERVFQRMDQFQSALEGLRKENLSLCREVFNGGRELEGGLRELEGHPEQKMLPGGHQQRLEHRVERERLEHRIERERPEQRFERDPFQDNQRVERERFEQRFERDPFQDSVNELQRQRPVQRPERDPFQDSLNELQKIGQIRHEPASIAEFQRHFQQTSHGMQQPPPNAAAAYLSRTNGSHVAEATGINLCFDNQTLGHSMSGHPTNRMEELLRFADQPPASRLMGLAEEEQLTKTVRPHTHQISYGKSDGINHADV